MINDQLKQLLRRADAQSEPALLPTCELRRRVENAARRKQQHKVTAVAVVIPVIVAVVGLTAWRPSPNLAPKVQREPATAISDHPTSTPKSQVVALPNDEMQRADQEFAALDAQANFHLQVAHRMIADREREATLALARRALTDGEPADAVRERLDLVAYRMIVRADRLRTDPQPNEDPTEIYREVVRLFPTTDSAAEARSRLAELHPVQPPGGA